MQLPLIDANNDFPNLPGVTLFKHEADSAALFAAVNSVMASSPLRRMTTPAGPMSVMTTSCGRLGWVSDVSGYRYAARDPETGRPWPVIPEPIHALAKRTALSAGYNNYHADACLINHYSPEAKMGLHQDRDEHDTSQPIVSISLGLSARFVIKEGTSRAGAAQAIILDDGDVLVFGGPARLAYHGISKVDPGSHSIWGPFRVNITLRCVRDRK
jgi:alkylated DNA repair protein (DNA oxidative demethylase)